MTREEAKNMRLFTQWQDDEEFLDIEASVVTKDHDLIIDKIYDDFESRTCGTCKYWSWANKEKTLKKCLGDNGCNITGDTFFCGNWEK